MARRRDRGPRPPTRIRGLAPFHPDQASTRPLGTIQPPSDIRDLVQVPPGARITRVLADEEGQVVSIEIDPGPHPDSDTGPESPGGPPDRV